MWIMPAFMFRGSNNEERGERIWFTECPQRRCTHSHWGSKRAAKPTFKGCIPCVKAMPSLGLAIDRNLIFGFEGIMVSIDDSELGTMHAMLRSSHIWLKYTSAEIHASIFKRWMQHCMGRYQCYKEFVSSASNSGDCRVSLMHADE